MSRRLPSPVQAARAALLAALLLPLMLAGCGRIGPVRPLRKALPAAPGQLRVEQKGARFRVGWNAPKVNQNGTPLTDLQGFRVYKMKYDPAKECPECRDTSILWQTVDVDYLRQAQRIDGRYYIWDDELVPGFGYQYRIVPFTRDGEDGATAVVRRPFFVPPPAPQGLVATGLDRLVRLKWRSAKTTRPGMQWRGYNVYRRSPGAPFPPGPINGAPLADTTFEDFGLHDGSTYLYAVRSVVRMGQFTVESPLSEAAEATPQPGH